MNAMIHREYILAALRLEQPDSVPLFDFLSFYHQVYPIAPNRLRQQDRDRQVPTDGSYYVNQVTT